MEARRIAIEALLFLFSEEVITIAWGRRGGEEGMRRGGEEERRE